MYSRGHKYVLLKVSTYIIYRVARSTIYSSPEEKVPFCVCDQAHASQSPPSTRAWMCHYIGKGGGGGAAPVVSGVLVWGLPQRHKTQDPPWVQAPSSAHPFLRGTGCPARARGHLRASLAGRGQLPETSRPRCLSISHLNAHFPFQLILRSSDTKKMSMVPSSEAKGRRDTRHHPPPHARPIPASPAGGARSTHGGEAFLPMRVDRPQLQIWK